jgi:hypothetical protein
MFFGPSNAIPLGQKLTKILKPRVYMIVFGLVFAKETEMLLLKFALSFFLLLTLPLRPAEALFSIDPVVVAIDSGSSSDLAKYFGSRISLNVNGQQGDFSRSQAELVIRDFFRKNPPKGFNILFRSDSNPSLSSYIGDYQCSQGQYKVLIKVSLQNSELKIYSLEFVKG